MNEVVKSSSNGIDCSVSSSSAAFCIFSSEFMNSSKPVIFKPKLIHLLPIGVL
ncbi:TPA: hypothetical protein I9080_003133 [Clostridium perfringens]|uniref:Uncharacterized protein n=1 Tax=Clostridium perfringens TaxID=1502 RepID=A0A8H9R005_CLOPF|nr:hypothetical protein [Clostridium perfringens]